jgi:hypothetical protein
MMPEQPYKPDELFRYYKQGMLDPDTLMTQILLNLIELYEVQQAHSALIEMMSEEISNLSRDIEALSRRTGTPRPSRMGRADDQTGDQNGTTGPDQGHDDEDDDDSSAPADEGPEVD